MTTNPTFDKDEWTYAEDDNRPKKDIVRELNVYKALLSYTYDHDAVCEICGHDRRIKQRGTGDK